MFSVLSGRAFWFSQLKAKRILRGKKSKAESLTASFKAKCWKIRLQHEILIRLRRKAKTEKAKQTNNAVKQNLIILPFLPRQLIANYFKCIKLCLFSFTKVQNISKLLPFNFGSSRSLANNNRSEWGCDNIDKQL